MSEIVMCGCNSWASRATTANGRGGSVLVGLTLPMTAYCFCIWVESINSSICIVWVWI